MQSQRALLPYAAAAWWRPPAAIYRFGWALPWVRHPMRMNTQGAQHHQKPLGVCQKPRLGC